MREIPACKHLRTKKMFIPALADAGSKAEESSHDNSHCWCNRTLTEVGPDDGPVGHQVCHGTRSCFQTTA